MGSPLLTRKMSDASVQKVNHVIIEPFHGGSHKQLIDGLVKSLYPVDSILVLTLPAKKWKWYDRLQDANYYDYEANFTDLLA